MFDVLKDLVAKRFTFLAGHDLFVVDVEKNEIFDAYLAGFDDPEIRQSNNCNCCKSFINHYGDVVAIINGKVENLWDLDIKKVPEEFKKSVAAIRDLVASKKITTPFRTKLLKLGTASNFQQLADGKVREWRHFNAVMPVEKVSRNPKSIESEVGNLMATKQVFTRALNEFTLEAVDEVLSLIAENSLYRGAEWKTQVTEFRKHKVKYDTLSDNEKEAYAWSHYERGGRLRNTVMGTLLIALSRGEPVEVAVRTYEVAVAPSNYRRTTSLISNTQVSAAKEKLKELGLESALVRRHATTDDIPLENVMFVNRTSATKDVFAELASSAARKPEKARKVSIAEFVENILPKTSNLELYVEASMHPVSLIAPSDPDAGKLFTWNNGISWSYHNNMTDIIKEKVKEAGGAIVGELRVSLEWFNHDDLDLHVVQPDGQTIYYANRRTAAGELDVDRNAGTGTTRTPVENIIFRQANAMRSGKYKVYVHNFARREFDNVGFNVQIENRGNIVNLSHPKALPNRDKLLVAEIDFDDKTGVTNITSELGRSSISRDVVGLPADQYHKVNMAMFSPNYWGENNIGNKHFFVILDGAKVETPLRPFFNEFLTKDLNEVRKVFESLASKLMVEPAEQTTTGVGHSLTQSGSMTFKVDGKPLVVEF